MKKIIILLSFICSLALQANCIRAYENEINKGFVLNKIDGGARAVLSYVVLAGVPQGLATGPMVAIFTTVGVGPELTSWYMVPKLLGKPYRVLMQAHSKEQTGPDLEKFYNDVDPLAEREHILETLLKIDSVNAFCNKYVYKYDEMVEVVQGAL